MVLFMKLYYTTSQILNLYDYSTYFYGIYTYCFFRLYSYIDNFLFTLFILLLYMKNVISCYIMIFLKNVLTCLLTEMWNLMVLDIFFLFRYCVSSGLLLSSALVIEDYDVVGIYSAQSELVNFCFVDVVLSRIGLLMWIYLDGKIMNHVR